MPTGMDAETRTHKDKIFLYVGNRVVGSKKWINNDKNDHERVIRELLGDCEISHRGPVPGGHSWTVVV